MTVDPVIPDDRLPALTGEMLRRLSALAPAVAVDFATAAGQALGRSLVFRHWPDLFDVGPLSETQRLYNEYFWFQRARTLLIAEQGFDAGLDQQAFQILVEQTDVDIDWDLVEALDERAR